MLFLAPPHLAPHARIHLMTLSEPKKARPETIRSGQQSPVKPLPNHDRPANVGIKFPSYSTVARPLSIVLYKLERKRCAKAAREDDSEQDTEKTTELFAVRIRSVEMERRRVAFLLPAVAKPLR
jgi:hypothetical protein